MQPCIGNRVPAIIFSYWVIKIASTTLGETGADLFSMRFDMGYATTSLIFMAIFVLFLAVKLSIKRYDPIVYWLVFTATSIVGTAMSDFMDRTLGLGYAAGSGILVLCLIASLALWYKVEKSISVEMITTSRAEIFYWVAFLFANTLGTAAGNYLADDLELGFAASAGIICSLLIITALMHYYTRVSSILLFWIAFVLTRPFGTTFGDFLTKPLEHGGLNLGTIGASLFFAVILAYFVWAEHKTHKKRLANTDETSIYLERISCRKLCTSRSSVSA